jgi:hypothetical protein
VNIPFFKRSDKAPATEIVIPAVVLPADMDEEQRQMVRAAAQLEVQTSFAMQDRVITEMATALRWVQASLLLVNGGAAVAVLQSQSVPAHVRTWSGGLFVTGIVLSLFATTLAAGRMSDTPVRLQRFAGYWLSVGIDLLRVEAVEREWQEYAIELQRRGRVPKMLGYAAAACFIVGCLIVGIGTF